MDTTDLMGARQTSRVFNRAQSRQTDTVEQKIRMWLHGRSEHTIRNYRRNVAAFRAFASSYTCGRVDLHASHSLDNGAPISLA